MCGIAGYFTTHGDCSIERDVLPRMVSMLRHRGPDGQATIFDDPVGLGHARLSIIDIAGGAQPICNEDGTVWLIQNGEIYNYIELREELLEHGHRFTTKSDSEVILHLYEEDGLDCLKRLNGQWALAIWDRKRQKLSLARDRMGVRPLYYAVANGNLLFSSEIKALLCHPAVPRRIDWEGLDQIFTYWCTLGARTMFEGVFELPPGSWLICEDGRHDVRRYWSLNFQPTDRKSSEEYSEELLRLLTDAIQIRLRSDVPVGAYLSGGLDSTVTTAIIRKYSDANLRTFSVNFSNAAYDESVFQQAASEFLHTDHTSLHCTAADIGRIFPDVIWHTEKPVLRTAPAPFFLLSRLVRDSGYKVVVTGEGADEVMGGYDIFKETHVRRFCAARPISTARASLFARLYPYLPEIQSQPAWCLQRFFQAEPRDLRDPFFSHVPRWRLTAGLKTFLARQDTTNIDCRYSAAASELPSDFSNWHWLAKAQYLESTMLLPGYILSSQGDRAAMANAVEGRLPFLDYRLVEFAAELPPHLKLQGLNEKVLLRRCSKGLVPPLINRRPKQPYRAPESDSFFAKRLDYVEELLDPKRIRTDEVFRPEAVAKLVEKVKSGRTLGVKDHMAVTGVISTQLFVDQFIRNFSRRS
jgi:asparagine synthase (glutamine-hydrolysing)